MTPSTSIPSVLHQHHNQHPLAFIHSSSSASALLVSKIASTSSHSSFPLSSNRTDQQRSYATIGGGNGKTDSGSSSSASASSSDRGSSDAKEKGKEKEKGDLENSSTTPSTATPTAASPPETDLMESAVALSDALKNAASARDFMTLAIPKSRESAAEEQSEPKEPKRRKSSSSTSSADKDPKNWPTKVRRGVLSFLEPITLKQLTDTKPISIPQVIASKLSSSSNKSPKLSIKDAKFPYPVHPATIASFESTIKALLSTTLQPVVSKLPSTSSGLILLSCPYKGSEIYLRKVTEGIAAEMNINGDGTGKEVVFMSISSDDLFPRFSGYDVVSAPPLRDPMNAQTSPLNPFAAMMGGSGKGNGSGRRRGSGGNVIQIPVGIVMDGKNGPNIGTLSASDGDDSVPDTPNVPYPWHSNYQSPKGGQMNLMYNRIHTETSMKDSPELIAQTLDTFFKEVSTAAQGKPTVIFFEDLVKLLVYTDDDDGNLLTVLSNAIGNARRKHPIVVVATSTPTFNLKRTKENKYSNMMGILQSFADADDDGSGGGEGGGGGNGGNGGDGGSAGSDSGNPFGGPSRRRSKPKPVKFDTPLDEYLGICTIPVYPPIHLGSKGVELFKRMMDRDLRLIYRDRNLKEIEVVANSAGLGLNVWDPVVMDVLTRKAGDLLGVSEGNGHSGSIKGFVRKGKNVGILDERILSPNEIEKLILLALGDAATVTAGAAKLGDILPLKEDHISKAVGIFAADLNAAEAVRFGAGLDLSSVFANPRDYQKLNSYELRLLNECLVKPSDLTTTFGSIGGLGKIKSVINDLIRLPLERPELFSYGVLKQSTTGLLLFGPPGTGKTMLARAIASESGANFLNVQMSSLQDKYVGENEKNVKALFSLARKLRPCVIFVDEIDALLKVRTRSQPSWVTNTINEWMQEWDGIQSESSKGIIVVGGTNRPFDLDEAVLRRLPRRILVPLPEQAERREILSLLLKEERLGEGSHDAAASGNERDEVLDKVAALTDSFSGSDLKNLCIAAALQSIRRMEAAGILTPAEPGGKSRHRVILLEDFEKSLKSGDVVPSLNDRAELMKQLVEWDKTYGMASGGKPRSSPWGFDILEHRK
ncbi:hypothetical protein HDU76_002187 [Blyttiomyces sp. JEL0837]|nr:hypothetical protein HDU76_002187 [Blyttiomyces sp. JEL0837]